MAELLPQSDLIDDESELAAERLARGTRLGRYELLLPIAKGGMARVWAARQHGQRGFTKLVAIKTILPHLARDAEFERMFLDEARIASMVHHPNVCEIYELGEEGRVLYLAMEWVMGESLAHVLRVSGSCVPLEPRIVARIVSDACAGLNAAHNTTDDDGRPLGLVHRDVSPHNILVSETGSVKVADFGVAKALGMSHSTTNAGQLKGKINYMAPEQVTGSGLDRRSDLFSVGCVLYEATTGVQPFKGEGDHQVMHRLLKGDVVPPSKLVPGYSPELEKIVLRALSQDPAGRFPSAERLRVALEEWLAKGPVVTETHVAGAVRARIGAILDKRRERIKATQFTTERVELAGEPPIVEGVTPSLGRTPGSGSGVKQTQPTSRRSGPDWGPPPPSSGPPRSSMPSVPPPRGSMPSVPPPRSSVPSLPSVPDPTPSYQPVLDARIVEAPTPSSHDLAPAPARPPETGMYATIGAILAAVAIFALGAIGYFLWRVRAHTPAPSPPAVTAPAAKSTADAPPIDTSITVEAVEPVMFHVSPDAAFLIVDGAEQAPGVRAVTRKPGIPVVVIVRAPGYEDERVTIDDAYTNRSVVVALRPTKRRASDPSKRNDPLPANPY